MLQNATFNHGLHYLKIKTNLQGLKYLMLVNTWLKSKNYIVLYHNKTIFYGAQGLRFILL